MTLQVTMSHNLTVPSSLPPATFFPSGDNAMVHVLLPSSRQVCFPLTAFFPFWDNALLSVSLFPSLQSSPICFPFFKFHARSEPSCEQVMIRCPPGRCTTPQTSLVCPSNFCRGVIADVSFVLAVGEVMLWQNFDYGVQCHLSLYLSNFEIVTYEEVSEVMGGQRGIIVVLIKN
jgi:hypothetical protein